MTIIKVKYITESGVKILPVKTRACQKQSKHRKQEKYTYIIAILCATNMSSSMMSMNYKFILR